MGSKDCHTPQVIAPLSGPMDMRSLPGDMPYGTWRWRQNFACTEKGKLCRRKGWTRLFDEIVPFQNQDLHDQLLDRLTYYDQATPPQDDQTLQEYPPDASICGTVEHTRTGARQPVTLLFEAVATNGVRRLLAGTQNRIYCARPTTGNWKVIADAYGGTPVTTIVPERRFQAAQVNDVVIFTNNFDEPLYWLFDQPTQGCAMQAVSTIPSLAEIGLTKAGTVCAWKGVIFFGDVEMDGEHVRHRVVWSDLNAPLSFAPAIDSIASFQDLDYGEKVLRFLPLGDFLLIYTTHAIWQCAYVGGEQVFQFTIRFSNPKGDLCLSFPNTLVAVGNDHFYASRDGIHRFNQFMTSPERVDWIHEASYFAFSTIDKSICDAHVAGYDPVSNEYWLSWIEVGRNAPRWTFTVNLKPETPCTDYIDHGFTAIYPHVPDERPDIDAFVKQNCICTQAELNALDADGSLQKPEKEGVNCTSTPAEECFTNTSSPAWTAQTMDLDGRTIENYFKETPDEDSLCSYLDGFDFDLICGDCNAATKFVLASAVDYCLKEYADVGYRDRCTVFTACGTYVQDGYRSILRTGAIRGKSDRDALNLNRIETTFYADAQATPSTLALRVGWSGVPVDPNNPACAINWRSLTGKQLTCATPTTAEQHEAAKTEPWKTIGWQMMFENRCLYLEFSIDGVGGLSCYSSVTPFVSGKLYNHSA